MKTWDARTANRWMPSNLVPGSWCRWWGPPLSPGPQLLPGTPGCPYTHGLFYAPGRQTHMLQVTWVHEHSNCRIIVAEKKNKRLLILTSEWKRKWRFIRQREDLLLCGDCMCVCMSLPVRVCVHSLVMLHLVTVRSCSFKKKKKKRLVMGCGEQHHMSNVTLATVSFSSAAHVHTVWMSVHNLHKHTSWVMTEGSHLSRGY